MTFVQASNRSYDNQILFGDRAEKWYMDAGTADVHFIFYEGEQIERIPAHKTLLAIGSDVFKAMFYGQLKEDGDIQLFDVPAAAFATFLKFFYNSRLRLDFENISDMLYLCIKYDVGAALNICLTFLRDTLTSDNFCFIYGLAIQFDVKELKHMCEIGISIHTKDVLQSTTFLECDQSVLGHILRLELLSSTEKDVFLACMSWVKHKSKRNYVSRETIEAYLGDLFHDIRFGSMTIEDFAEIVSSYGHTFSNDEYQEIIKILGSSRRSERLSCNHRKGFNFTAICEYFHIFGRCPIKIKGFEPLSDEITQTILELPSGGDIYLEVDNKQLEALSNLLT